MNSDHGSRFKLCIPVTTLSVDVFSVHSQGKNYCQFRVTFPSAPEQLANLYVCFLFPLSTWENSLADETYASTKYAKSSVLVRNVL